MVVLVFQPLYVVVIAGIFLYLLLVFEVLVGLRVISFKGPAHWRTHKAIAFTLAGLALVHGLFALGTLVFAWF
jgi:hypothetical protein